MLMEKIVETKICKHCSSKFYITAKDLEFYEKVSPVFPVSQPFPPREKGVEKNFSLNWGGIKGGALFLWNGKVKYLIPSPTLCPDCRYQRRLSWRNERSLYKRKCDFSGRDIISMYSPDKPYKVYDKEIWWSDKWNPLDYGRDFDFSKSFFDQFEDLMMEFPRLWLVSYNCEKCSYNNHIIDSKNCYFLFSWISSENCLYGRNIRRCQNCVDNLQLVDSENCSNITIWANNYNCHFWFHIFHCENSKFLWYCDGCSNCFLCTNLVNKKYYYKNKPYTRQEYEEIMSHINFFDVELLISEFNVLINNSVHKATNMINNEGLCSTDFIRNSKNAYESYNISFCNDIKYCFELEYSQDVYDGTIWISGNSLVYESLWMGKNSNNSMAILLTSNMSFSFYSDNCFNSSNLFWCIWLKNKSYCILNKQYPKEEYESLVPKIIEHMQKTGEWWEFFPSSLSPFWYNETVANEYFPLTREKVLCHPEFISGSLKGKFPNYDSETSSEWQKIEWKFRKWTIFNWSDYEAPFPKVEKVIPASKLPHDIKEIPDDILNWAIECEITKKPFRIIPQELEFYRKHNLPIPKRHPDQRHLDRMALRNPRKLFTRKCNKCDKEIQTTYAPERLEIVYCEDCYNKEIY